MNKPMNERMMTVEIHDISPVTLDRVKVIHRALATIGVERCSLLVIPRHQEEGGRCHELTSSRETISWLQERQAAGAEIIQHGLTHRAEAPPPAGLYNAWMHRWFSRGCAEFAHLTERCARERLLEGREILRRCDLHARGFIAPAWQQSQPAIRALLALGFHFTAFINQIWPLRSTWGPIFTPALTFVAGHPLIDYPKRGLMKGLEWWARPVSILRVAIHPEDLTGARPLTAILRRIKKLRPHRRLVTYNQWLDQLPVAA